MTVKATLAAITAAALLASSGSAFAQGRSQGSAQGGLVNVAVQTGDIASGNVVTVQVPVNAAVQVCPEVTLLEAQQAAESGDILCEINQEAAAEHNIDVPNSGG